MSIADKLSKLQTDVTNAYSSIESKGGTIPANKNTQNLASAIDTITGGGGTTAYTVTFNSNGGSAVASQQIVEGYTAVEPSNPTKAGYGFNCWTLNGVQYDFSTPVTQNITLVASWEEILTQLVNYTMMYDLGNECTEITGGWNGLSAWTNAKATKNSNNLYLHASTASFTTKSKVDLTNYAKVYAFCKNANMGAGGWVIQVADALVNKNGWGIDWEAGIWTRSAANGNYLANLDVSNITNSQYCSVRVNDGNNAAYLSIYNIFLAKQDNWQELCTRAGLSSSDYTDEATLCADSTAIATILSNERAVRFMIAQCTGSFMAEFVSNSACLTALNNSTYKTIIQANEHWNKFLSMVA